MTDTRKVTANELIHALSETNKILRLLLEKYNYKMGPAWELVNENSDLTRRAWLNGVD